MLKPLTAPQVLLWRLIDYAGMYPPESLSLEDAVRTYLRHRQSPYEWMLGPFLCPSSQLHDLEWLLGGVEVAVGVVIDQPPAEAAVSIAASGLRIRQVETKDLDLRTEFEVLDRSFIVWLEAPPARVREIASLFPDRRIGVKVRCGGLTPEMFPTPSELAETMREAFVSGLPMKATAGLHHPWRHFSDGVWRHGFLNLLAAAAVLLTTGDQSLAERMLTEEEPGALGRQQLRFAGQTFTSSDLKSARVFFRSYGSCSFDEPVDDLLTMGSIWGAR